MYTNNYINNITSKNENLHSQREKFSIFLQYHSERNTAYGCRFTIRRINKESIRYDCSMCRKIADKAGRANKNIGSTKPAYFVWSEGGAIKWIQRHHLQECVLTEYGDVLCRSAKNDAVVDKSKKALTSKQAYDSQYRNLLKDAPSKITAKNINNSFKNFAVAKHALNKAHKRKNASVSSNFLDENKRIKLDSTVITPTHDVNESKEYFLIYESPTGSVLLGTKFLVEQFFNSKTVMSDGTFKIAPHGYSQTYILWFIIEDSVEGEPIPRIKAIAAAYFLMKTKTQEEYEELFGALEYFR